MTRHTGGSAFGATSTRSRSRLLALCIASSVPSRRPLQANPGNADLFVYSPFLGDGSLLYGFRFSVSFRSVPRNSSTDAGGSCSPPRLRGDTLRSVTSRSPITIAYGTLFSWDPRIL